ncbi:Sterol 3-beta-glucosyltransferase UGT80B1 [Exophiala dermatitidis]
MSPSDPSIDPSPQGAPAIPSILLEEADAAAASAHEAGGDANVASPGPEGHVRHHGDASTNVEEVPPPAYNGADYGQLDIDQNGLETGARIASDGRVNIKINQRSCKLTDLLIPALRRQLELQREKAAAKPSVPEGLGETEGLPPPPMNIAIQIVGSRGDVQPFVALGQVLKNKYNHRVRIATHPTFKQFVIENGLEFFSIGGDPAELMAFMVKNPGLMPGWDSLRNGDVGKRRRAIYEMITGCWRSCIEAGDGTGQQVTDDNMDTRSFDSGVSLNADLAQKPFIADAIIANPPSFAHVHIAEKLGIPLHLMFTMPWSPTQAFPHPLANIISSNTDPNMANFVTYALVDMLTWQGLGDIINRFRERTLGLEPVSIMWAPGMTSRLRIPWTYCWSPALIPKPADWGDHIDISGFFFLNLSTNYTPPKELADFLEAGPPPVYIGFGSIVVDDPNAMTRMIFKAVEQTGQRAIISKGWGGLGADKLGIPDGVFMLGNCPHDWLFNRVSCVVHHGGAGTTAAGILAGRPTVVVPFFGDQPFWGSMLARAGAGPPPIAYKDLTSEKLANSIKEALKPESLERARELSAKIRSEDGTSVGAESFHKHANLPELRCSLVPTRTAVWTVKKTNIRLSPLAAAVLGNEGLLDFSDLKLYRPREYETEDGPWEPISGAAAALIGTIGNLSMGVADFPVEILRSLRTASGDLKEIREKRKARSGTSTPIPGEEAASLNEARSSEETSTPTLSSTASTWAMSEKSQETAGSALPKSSAMATVMSADGSIRSPQSRRRSCSLRSSRSGSPLPRGEGGRTPSTGEEVGQVSLETAIDGARAVGKIVSAGMKSPLDFTLSLAKGFHNAPKLYGDDTVRRNEKIVDFQSGLRVAGKEFGYGFYDGITGLVTQPMAGAKKEGAAGFFKGAAKGFGGLILKPGAAIWGLPGYTAKGLYAEISKRFGSSVQNYIIAARVAQGYEDWKSSTPEESAQIVSKWKESLPEHRKGVATPQKNGRGIETPSESNTATQTESGESTELPSGFWNTRHLSFDERKTLAAKRDQLKKEQKELQRREKEAKKAERKCASKAKMGSNFRPDDHENNQPVNLDDVYEHAIQTSIEATSRGDPVEDALIERALRASLRELHGASASGATTNMDENDEAYNSAIKASMQEYKTAQAEQQQSVSSSSGSAYVAVEPAEGEEQDDELEKVLKQSLEEFKAAQPVARGDSTGGKHSGEHETNLAATAVDDGESDDDEALRQTLKESQRLHVENEQKKKDLAELEASMMRGGLGNSPAAADDDRKIGSELDEGIGDGDGDRHDSAQSERQHLQEKSFPSKQRTEEEIVLEYIKKQSLLEQELKNAHAHQGSASGTNG